MFFRQNVDGNSPRMLLALQRASERGVPIIVYNPLREGGCGSRAAFHRNISAVERAWKTKTEKTVATGY
jgi:hypothetical protein